jgi:hypothetical protein
MSTDQAAGGILRRTLNRIASSQDDIEARELQSDVVKTGCRAIAGTGDRSRVRLHGTINTVTLRPRGGVPALEAELYDGSGTVTVIWLGRRRIAGVEPGRSVLVEGTVSEQKGHRVLFNPRYELRA